VSAADLLPADGIALVEELGRRFRAGDLDGAFALYDDDVRIVQPASLPHGGEHAGRDGIVAMGQTFAQHWDRTIGPPLLLACGGTVVQVTAQTWVAKATGRSAVVDVVELITVEGGLVRRIEVFPRDTHLLLATLPDPDAAEGGA